MARMRIRCIAGVATICFCLLFFSGCDFPFGEKDEKGMPNSDFSEDYEIEIAAMDDEIFDNEEKGNDIIEKKKPDKDMENDSMHRDDKAEQNKAEQNKAEQNKAEQNKAEQNKAEQNKAEQNNSEQNSRIINDGINEESYEVDKEFYASVISDEIFDRIKGKSYKDNCTLPKEDLRYLHILHKTLDGEIKVGEIVCNKYIADDVLDIFKELFDADYPVERVELVDEYDADDEKSMSANNSSSFNFRFISYTTTVSNHGLGLAIDINPLYNPYVKEVNGKLSIEPAAGANYVDRDGDYPYKIDENDLAYRLFTERGFEWGGNWKNSKDYQHFELNPKKIRELYPK